MNKPIYLDANASEPIRESVIAEMITAMQITGNPSSVHQLGRRCYHKIEDAREVIVDYFGGELQNCIFTSGGTEADILAVYGQKRERPLWVGATEHPAISKIDLPKTVLPVTKQGTIDLDILEQQLQKASIPPFICLMLANSETGVIHPIKQVATLCHHYGALLHVDAVQAAGRMPANLDDFGADSMAISAHKMGGPKGIGVLLLSSENNRAAKRLDPLFVGGGQEQGRRGGTQAMPLIVGMAEAIKASYAQDRTNLLQYRMMIEAAAKEKGAVVCGEQADRLDNTSSLAFAGITAQRQLMALDMAGFCVSTGSACSSGKVGKSPVLTAMGLGDLAEYSIRVSLPWNITQREVEQFIEAYGRVVFFVASSGAYEILMINHSIYLDYQATTPCDKRVLAAMLPYFTDYYGNAHSEHYHGQQAFQGVALAREQVATLLGVKAQEIIFTSGATESNNIAIQGCVHYLYQQNCSAKRVITVCTEHKSVLEPIYSLKKLGIEIVILPVNSQGIVDIDCLKQALQTPTLLVSIMAANNETGIIQPIEELATLTHNYGALFHCDMSQSIGKIANLSLQHIDLASLSGHKIYAPKGIGALYIRRKPRVRVSPLVYGGPQERGIRSGTLPVPLIAGFGKACAILSKEGIEESQRLKTYKLQLLNGLTKAIPEIKINGDLENSLSGCINLRIPDVRALDFLNKIPHLCLSTGSACTVSALMPSYVLMAMGISKEEALQSFRLSFGRMTTPSSASSD